MVDTSRFGKPESKPDTSRFGKPDTSRFGKPADETKPEEPGLGEHLYGGAVGLISNLAGIPGDIESLGTTEEATPELQARRQIFPPSSYIKKQFPTPAPGTEPSVALGEDIPLIVGGTKLVQSLPKAISSGVGKLSDLATRLTGSKVAKESEDLISKIASERGLLQKQLDEVKSQTISPQRQGEVDRLNSEIAKRDQALQQLKQQPKVAERKAETQAPAPTVGPQAMKPLREEVRSTKIAPALKEAETKTAVLTETEKKAAQAKTIAEQKIDQLDKELLANPTIDKNTFGGKLRTILEDIKKKYAPIRSKEADYAGVKTKYGDKPVVSTDSIVNLAKKDFEQSGSQAEKNFLSQIIKNLETDGKNNISVIKADSNIKTLDKMIDGFEEAGYAINKDMAIKFQKYKDMLIGQTPKEYQTARKTWQELSRPLDIVEQRTGGGLAQVLEENSLSLQDKLADAQVVGEVIKKANQGHPVLSRMLAESPDLKESARLYFAQDLFGAKIAPSETELARWIETNGNALDQLGLRSEFQNMRNAKATAQEAVDVAKGRFNQAAHDRKMAEMVQSQLQSKAQAQTKRIGETKLPEAKELPKGYQQPKTLAEKQAEAQKAKTRLESEKGKSQTEIEKINKQESERMTTEQAKKDQAISELSKAQADIIRGSDPKQVAKNASTAAKSLYDSGYIDLNQYNELQDAAKKLTGSIGEREIALNKLNKFVKYGLFSAGVGYVGRETVGSMLP